MLTDQDFKQAGYRWHSTTLKEKPCEGCWQKALYSDDGDLTFYLTAWKWDWPNWKIDNANKPKNVSYEFDIQLRPYSDDYFINVVVGGASNCSLTNVEEIFQTTWDALFNKLNLRPYRTKGE